MRDRFFRFGLALVFVVLAAGCKGVDTDAAKEIDVRANRIDREIERQAALLRHEDSPRERNRRLDELIILRKALYSSRLFGAERRLEQIEDRYQRAHWRMGQIESRLGLTHFEPVEMTLADPPTAKNPQVE